MPQSIDLPALPDPERFWAEILSADPERIRHAFDRLAADEAQLVLAHLRRMATDEGWHTAQRASSGAALSTLETRPSSAGREGP